MSADPYAFASQAAEQIVKGMGVTALPINPCTIAEKREIVVQAKPVEDKGCSGMLVRLGNDFAIAYATHLQNEGFENFSIAHELGHYFMPGHVEAVIQGETGMHLSRAGFNSGNKYEAEADRFAAGLLMPRHLFFPAIDRAGEGLAAIEALATLCKTSLHATAIRYTQCARDPVAIIVSRGGVIDHCFMSEALKQLDGIDWLKKREGVPRNTATFAFNQVPANVEHGVRQEETSNLQHWFGGKRHIEISEDVVGLGRYGKTLTVLYGIDLPDPEEEEDENNLIKSWTPRFKR
ncbi:ImmA/IrrE family metallo-endopeptidase [Bordetella tumulicola]|uniref:ImmA/IrrE family metallo-endopeptidase n=1 Tax=Bordetella tumulicola TaxID=1649133 RepID=UPI0039EFB867